MWLGGGMASMIAGVVAKQFGPSERLAVYRATAAVHRVLVRGGALAVVISGFSMALRWMRAGAGMPLWLNVMMGAGLVGAIVAGAFSVPTARALGRLELDARGELPEAFPRLRKRQAIVATIAGGLGIVALIAGTILRG
jgi:hypothetical protein